jgi:tetratricopeptide (TPR) repeat protein
MSLFRNIFGRKKEEPKAAPPVPAPPSAPAAPPQTPTDPSKDPNLIRVFDAYGREMFITRKVWRDSVLLGNLKKAWNQPDELYNMIVGALNDGFRPDVIDAAKHLYEIDPNPMRGACVWGIVLMEEGRIDEAEHVFRDHTTRHGEDGVILTNLAKVYAKRKNDAKAELILWHALELDPNQENGMGWYEVIHREHGGADAGQEALRRIAALPGSWRAQLWLARAALQSRQLEPALTYYRESLSHLGRPVPTDVLMQISGDLGNAAHLPELIALAEPHFDPAFHGIMVGNNLIKAHLDLGQLDAARQILDQLYAQKRPDWRETLSFWDTELAKAKINPVPLDTAAPLEMAMLTIQGPVWLKPDSPAAELFPAKPQDGPLVSFLGGSVEITDDSTKARQQMPDAKGRISRSLPLFLAEQLEFSSTARVQTLIPWLVSKDTPGFVLSGKRSGDDSAAHLARQGEVASDFAVTIHLDPRSEPWSVELRLVRMIDAKCVGELRAEFPVSQPEEAFSDLARRLLVLLRAESDVRPLASQPLYQIPATARFPYYLLRLEQLLAIRCGSMDGVPHNFLSGEREILDGNIQLCLDCPDSIPARVLLAQTFLAMKRIRPDIMSEYPEKLALLQKEKPLPEPAQSVVQRLIHEATGA